MDLSAIQSVIGIAVISLLASGGLATLAHLFGVDSREQGVRDGRPVRWL